MRTLRTRLEIVDDYARKLLTSGFSVYQTRRILVNGIKGYENKRRRCLAKRTRLHRSSKESLASQHGLRRGVKTRTWRTWTIKRKASLED